MNGSLVRALGAVLVAFMLSGCVSSVPHVFGFDLKDDDQDAVVLEYRYGSESQWVGHTENDFRDGRVYWGDRRMVNMRRPEFLYVKWRNRNTGQVFEDKVDLRQRLPRDLKDQTVYFMIRGAQLYVYLASDQLRPPDVPPNGPRIYKRYLVSTIYPGAVATPKNH